MHPSLHVSSATPSSPLVSPICVVCTQSMRSLCTIWQSRNRCEVFFRLWIDQFSVQESLRKLLIGVFSERFNNFSIPCLNWLKLPLFFNSFNYHLYSSFHFLAGNIFLPFLIQGPIFCNPRLHTPGKSSFPTYDVSLSHGNISVLYNKTIIYIYIYYIYIYIIYIYIYNIIAREFNFKVLVVLGYLNVFSVFSVWTVK